MPPPSDLVRDSKLETRILDGQTVHSYNVTHHSRRRIYQEECWKRERLLGQGSYGQVWLEKCTSSNNIGQLRAVKVVRKEPLSNVIEFDRELEAVAKFSHTKYETWFVKSFGWYEDKKAVYIAMEFCPLGDLQRYISSKSSLPLTEAQELTYQILEGLHEMHENGFTHRDLKPANVLIKSQPPEFWWVKLADFGISKRADEGNGPSTVKGTLEFMAPELLGWVKSTKDPKLLDYQAADMWALGETAFRMLTGKRTFEDIRTLTGYFMGTQEFPLVHLASFAGDNGVPFISNLMAVDPYLRMSAKDALQHPWMKLHSKDNDEDRLLGPNSHSSLPERTEVPEEPQPGPFYEASARWSTFSQTGTIKPATRSRVQELSNPVQIPHEKQSKQTGVIASMLSSHNPGQDPHPSYARIDGDSNSSGSYSENVLTTQQSGSSISQVKQGTELFRNTVQDQHPGGNQLLNTMQEDHGHSSVQDLTGSPGSFTFMAERLRRMLKIGSGAALQTLKGHSRNVVAVAFSPDGKQLASASWDKTVRLWDAGSGAALQTLEGHSGNVVAVAFSPDGKQLASASWDKTVRLWDAGSGEI